MPFEGTAFLSIAKYLANTSSHPETEGRLRTAVGRSYYAAFWIARKYAENLGFISREDGDDHGRLRAFFASRGKFSWLPGKLSQLRLWRNECDYKNQTGNLSDMAASSIEEAEIIRRKLSPP
jgi:uncharacterized protein (UPF0332 family)